MQGTFHGKKKIQTHASNWTWTQKPAKSLGLPKLPPILTRREPSFVPVETQTPAQNTALPSGKAETTQPRVQKPRQSSSSVGGLDIDDIGLELGRKYSQPQNDPVNPTAPISPPPEPQGFFPAPPTIVPSVNPPNPRPPIQNQPITGQARMIPEAVNGTTVYSTLPHPPARPTEEFDEELGANTPQHLLVTRYLCVPPDGHGNCIHLCFPSLLSPGELAHLAADLGGEKRIVYNGDAVSESFWLKLRL